MLAKHICVLFTIGCISLIIFFSSCGSKSEKKGVETVKIDSARIIETGLDHLFKTQKFAPDFYSQSVKIIRSANIPRNLSFLVNGKQIELVDPRTRGGYINDLNHPSPFVSVSKLSVGAGNVVDLELEFPTIGFVYVIKLNQSKDPAWKVKEFSFFMI
jgi:hypothetical protein